MRIAILGPIEYRTPPLGYGSTELIVWYLTRRLTLMGHSVFAMARKDSMMVVENFHPCDRRKPLEDWDKWGVSPANFDVLHDKFGGHPIANKYPDGPFITTEHGQSKPTGNQPCAISQDQADKWEQPDMPVLYNGIDPDFYRYSNDKNGYVLYLGSVQAIKGVHDWLKVLKMNGRRGVIAGNRHEVHCPGYWQNKCQPIIDSLPKHQTVEVIGEVSGSTKVNLFAKASCFLFLPKVREAFGTVLIEALVSGTPVVSWDIGPMREIIGDGGIVVPYQNHEAAAQAIEQVTRIHPIESYYQGCKFSDVNMAKAHLKVYKQVASGVRWNYNPNREIDNAKNTGYWK